MSENKTTPKDGTLDISSGEEQERSRTQRPVESFPPIESSQESVTSGYEEQRSRNNIHKMFEELQGDIIRSFVTKSKEFRKDTYASLKGLNESMKQRMKAQQQKREEVYSHYHEILQPLFEQLESDRQNSGKDEEKFLNMSQYHAKIMSQSRAVQEKNVEDCKKYYHQLVKTIRGLDENKRKLIISEKGKVKKEMDNLMKGHVKETRHQDMASLEKCLKPLLPETEEERMST